MRRELQVEPLILCLVQPAPSGTRAYIPKITEDQNNHNRNRNRNNQNFQKINNNKPNNSNNPKNLNTQNNPKSSKESLFSPEKEESFEGRTRRRRSAVTS